MKLTTTLTLVAVVLCATGCGLMGGYDPNDPVSISVEADSALNTYDGVAHRMDLYVYRLTDPLAFEAASVADLRKEKQAVPGGQGLSRQSVSPGQISEVPVGRMQYEMYTHLGIVASYKEPKGQTRVTAPIPSDGHFRLVLGPNGIISFTEAD